MPLYYFHIRWNGRGLDEGGLWFPTLQQAEQEAKRVAEELRHRLGGNATQVTITIRDQHDRIQTEILAVSD